MPNIKPILFFQGILLSALGLAMLLPALADIAAGELDWQAFVGGSVLTVGVGSFLMLANWGVSMVLNVRQGFLLTTSSWTVLTAFAALPFLFSNLDLSYADAYFEAMSGLTTTGSTVLVGLDTMSPGILLWRALLQWLGGIGIIVMAVGMLPFLRVGGMQLFRTESSDRSDKALPRARQIATTMTLVYLLMTFLCGLAYGVFGMTAFEAVAHAMTTVSTAGYSTSDASMAHFPQPAIHWTATLFMFLGALPFVLYVRLLRGQRGGFWRESQVRTLLMLLIVTSMIVTVWLYVAHSMDFFEALRHAAFSVTSVVTTTGYATTDYQLWGSWIVMVFFLLTFFGGCTGSTTGGLKMLRFEVLAIMAKRQVQQLTEPHAVFALTYGGKHLSEDVQRSVAVFVSLFFGTWAIISLLLAATGLDIMTSITGAATALANVGPGLGSIIGPVGNFAPLPDAAKWILSVAMLIGRLEIFTVLVLLSPQFWH